MSEDVKSASPFPTAAADAEQAQAARSRRVLLFACLLAAGGMALLVLYLRRFEAEASGGERIRVLTLVTSAAPGTVLTDEMLGEREVPVSYVEPRAVRAAERRKVTGLKLGSELDPQDGLLWTDLSLDVEHRDLSSLVQPGHRAVTIETRQNAMIRPGDYVDVLANLGEVNGGRRAEASVVLLQRVVVLAVGDETDRQAFEAREQDKHRRSSGRRPTLTLSVRLEEAQLLALTAQQGALSVVVRDQNDPTVTGDPRRVTLSSLAEAAARANDRRAAQHLEHAPTRITGEVRR